MRRESARLTARRDDAVTGDDQRDRVLAKRLADLPRRVRLAQGLRDVAIGACLSGGDLAADFIDATREGIDAVKFERDAVEILHIALQVFVHGLDERLDRRRWCARLTRAGLPRDARLRRLGRGLRQLKVSNRRIVALGPSNTAPPERRLEHAVCRGAARFEGNFRHCSSFASQRASGIRSIPNYNSIAFDSPDSTSARRGVSIE